jgi:hypothetical protein
LPLSRNTTTLVVRVGASRPRRRSRRRGREAWARAILESWVR